MSTYKKLKTSDVITIPYVANKAWNFSYVTASAMVTDPNINVYRGQKYSGSFSPVTDFKGSMGEWPRLVYDQINHLFYQQFTDQLNTGSLAGSIYYESASSQRPTSSYYNYDYNDNIIKTFPTGLNQQITVLSVSKNLYGSSINPGTFQVSSSLYNIKDDSNGNIFDGTIFVGNIFYSLGIVVITNQNYINFIDVPAATTTTTTTATPVYQQTFINQTDQSFAYYFKTGSILLETGFISPGETRNTDFTETTFDQQWFLQPTQDESHMYSFSNGIPQSVDITVASGSNWINLISNLAFVGLTGSIYLVQHILPTTTTTTTTAATTTTTTIATTTTTTSTTTTTTTVPTTTTTTTTTSTTTTAATTAPFDSPGNFSLEAQYNMTINSVSGSGVPLAFLTANTSAGVFTKAFTTMPAQTFHVALTGNPPTGLGVVMHLYVNDIVRSTVSIPSIGTGTYFLSLPSPCTISDAVVIAIDT